MIIVSSYFSLAAPVRPSAWGIKWNNAFANRAEAAIAMKNNNTLNIGVITLTLFQYNQTGFLLVWTKLSLWIFEFQNKVKNNEVRNNEK